LFFYIGDDLLFAMSSRSDAVMGIVLTEVTCSSWKSKRLTTDAVPQAIIHIEI